MQLALFGTTDEGGFVPGWLAETVLLLFGGADLDLTKRPPAPDATLTVVAIFGGAKVVVPAGSRVTAGGFSLFGGRSVKVGPGAGPDLRLNAVTVFGGIEVVEAPARLGAERPAEGVEAPRTFPF